jgi:hypothetical protein
MDTMGMALKIQKTVQTKLEGDNQDDSGLKFFF